MSTEINPENEQFIQIAIANGDFESRDDILNGAMGRLRVVGVHWNSTKRNG